MATRPSLPDAGGGQTGGGGNGSFPGGGGNDYGGPDWVCPTGSAPAPFADTWGAPRSGGRRHQGVDMIGTRGIPVLAVVDGVAEARQNILGGTTIWLTGVDGNGYYYAHLDGYLKLGSVTAGTPIGILGQTGNAQFSIPHLHFEVHPGEGPAVNPYPTVAASLSIVLMVGALDDGLAAVLGATEIANLTRLSGGASRDTWRFQADGRRLIVQRQREGDVRDMATEIAAVRAAGAAGVPTASIVAASTDVTQLGAAYMILTDVAGETTPRKILRDDEYERARHALPAQLAEALVKVHAIDPATIPGLTGVDQVTQYREVLDTLGQPHPTFELALRWLDDNRPPPVDRGVVHGDFRLGNVIVGDDGLAGGARLGAGPHRGSDGGPRLAVRQGVAFRLAEARRRRRRVRRTVRRVRGSGGRHGRSRQSCVGGRCSAR